MTETDVYWTLPQVLCWIETRHFMTLPDSAQGDQIANLADLSPILEGEACAEIADRLNALDNHGVEARPAGAFGVFRDLTAHCRNNLIRATGVKDRKKGRQPISQLEWTDLIILTDGARSALGTPSLEWTALRFSRADVLRKYPPESIFLGAFGNADPVDARVIDTPSSIEAAGPDTEAITPPLDRSGTDGASRSSIAKPIGISDQAWQDWRDALQIDPDFRFKRGGTTKVVGKLALSPYNRNEQAVRRNITRVKKELSKTSK